MKKREEMIRDVHRRIDEYEAEHRAKSRRLTKTAFAAVPVCAAAAVGIGLWKSGALSPAADKFSGASVETTAVVTETITAEIQTAVPTETAAPAETVPVTETSTEEEPAGNFSVGDMSGAVIYNETVFLQFFPEDGAYTADAYIGNGDDLEGFYEGTGDLTRFYTAKEDAEVIVVEFTINGGKVYLKKDGISADSFRKELEKIKEMERNGAVF